MANDVPVNVSYETRFARGSNYIVTRHDILKLVLLYSVYVIIYIGNIKYLYQPVFESLGLAIFVHLAIALCVYILVKNIHDGNISGSALVNQFISGAFQYSILKYGVRLIGFTSAMLGIGFLIGAFAIMGMIPNVVPLGDDVDVMSPEYPDYRFKEQVMISRKISIFLKNIEQQSLNSERPLRMLLFQALRMVAELLYNTILVAATILVLWLLHRRYKWLNKNPNTPGTMLRPTGMVLYANIGALGVVTTSLVIETLSAESRLYPVYTVVDMTIKIVLYMGSQTLFALEEARGVVFDLPNDISSMAGKLLLFMAAIFTLRHPSDLPSGIACFSRSSCYFELFRFCLRVGLIVVFGLQSWKRFRIAVGEERAFSHAA